MEQPRALEIEKHGGKGISRLPLREPFCTINKSELVNEMFIIDTIRASAASVF